MEVLQREGGKLLTQSREVLRGCRGTSSSEGDFVLCGANARPHQRLQERAAHNCQASKLAIGCTKPACGISENVAAELEEEPTPKRNTPGVRCGGVLVGHPPKTAAEHGHEEEAGNRQHEVWRPALWVFRVEAPRMPTGTYDRSSVCKTKISAWYSIVNSPYALVPDHEEEHRN